MVPGRQSPSNVFEAEVSKPTDDLIETVKIVDRRARRVEVSMYILLWKALFQVFALLVERHELCFVTNLDVRVDFDEFLGASGLSVDHEEKASAGPYGSGCIRHRTLGVSGMVRDTIAP